MMKLVSQKHKEVLHDTYFKLLCGFRFDLSSAEERKIEKLKYLSPPWVGYKISAQQAQ